MKRILTITLLCGLLSAGPAWAIKSKSTDKKEKPAATAPAKVKKVSTAGSRRKSQQGLLKKLRDQKGGKRTTRKKDVFIDKNNDGVDDRVAPKVRKKKPPTTERSKAGIARPNPGKSGAVKRVRRDTTKSSRTKRDPR